MSLLEIDNVKKLYHVRKFGSYHRLMAVNGVSFTIEKGKCVGLVGESGCGKSTLGRLIVGLETPLDGEIRFNGDRTHGKRDKRNPTKLKYSRDIQLVFQDSYDAVNPRYTAKKIIEESLKNFTKMNARERDEMVDYLLKHVGIPVSEKNKYAMEFSGGQLQRVCIARALASDPKLLVLDEPLSSLDVSVQAQILNLLSDIKKERDISYLFISHDLQAVYYLADAMVVMYGGQIMEKIDDISFFNKMIHPYTKKLLSSTEAYEEELDEEKQAEIIWMNLGVQKEGYNGCPYCSRCPHATQKCEEERPEMVEFEKGHYAACHRINERGKA